VSLIYANNVITSKLTNQLLIGSKMTSQYRNSALTMQTLLAGDPCGERQKAAVLAGYLPPETFAMG